MSQSVWTVTYFLPQLFACGAMQFRTAPIHYVTVSTGQGKSENYIDGQNYGRLYSYVIICETVIVTLRAQVNSNREEAGADA